jgi:DNA-directed RNA polymerase subunit beta'
VLNINQDIVLGNYYLTYDKPSAQTDKVAVFASSREAELAYDMGKLQLQSPIRVRAKGEIRTTTLGRVFFNEILPEDFPYDDNIQNKKQLKKVLAQDLRPIWC